MKTYLIIDSNHLCYRSFHTLDRNLEYDGIPTAITFGFFSQILHLMEMFQTEEIIFTFDYGKVLRKSVYPSYKSARKAKRDEMSDGEKLQYKQMKKQITSLRLSYLKRVGFRNIFFQNGYESDDIIASICHHSIPKNDKAIIVSSDGDLFQLLSNRITMWNSATRKIITLKTFQDKYGISASLWADVKAMAGCTTDSVEGILGIGEKTACKFLAGTLKPETKAHKKIVDGRDIWSRNLPLVELPYEGTNKFELVENEVRNKTWKKLMEELGMNSLKREMPFGR